MLLTTHSPILAIVWQPVAPPLQIALGAFVLCGLAVWAYLRVSAGHRTASTILLLMRLCVIGAVATLLMGPSREEPQEDSSQKSRLTILLDTSQSMLTEDCGSDARIEYVVRQVLDEPQLQRLQEEFQVSLLGFDEQTHPLPMGPLQREPAQLATGRATHLAESVTGALTQMNPQAGDAVILISDGRDTNDASMQPAASLAESKHVPIYSVGVGGAESTVDAALLAVPLQDYLLPNEPGGILVKLYQAGLEDESATVRVKQGDTVEQYPIRFSDRGVVEVQVPIRQEEPGQYEYEVTMDPVGDEAEMENNGQVLFCEVMQRRIRVLCLEGQPFWDSKFPAQSLRRDERIELTQVTQLGHGNRETIVSRVEDRGPQLPTTREEWADFDVVMVGRNLENVLDAEAAGQLVDFVGSGGHLILMRGLPYDRESPRGEEIGDALRVIEPVVWGTGQFQELSIELTPSGRVSQWLTPVKMGVDVGSAFERLPGFDVMAAVEREKPGTLVLARAHAAAGPGEGGMPALVTMNYGRGTVAAVMGEGHWKWSLLTPENEDLRGFYDTLWSNLVRWLAMGGDFQPGQQVALTLSRVASRLGDEMTVDVTYKHQPPIGADPLLELRGPDGEPAQVALHRLPGSSPRFRARLAPDAVGTHEVTLTAPGMTPAEISKRFSVYDVNLERLQTAANAMPLRILAEHSGGAFFQAEFVNDLHDQLRRHRQSLLSPPKLQYLWDQGMIMTLLLVWMGMEWIFRRLTGLW
jgi:hypothetical protein